MARQEILIPYDGSPTSADALALGEELSALFGISASVLGLTPEGPVHDDSTVRRLAKARRAALLVVPSTPRPLHQLANRGRFGVRLAREAPCAVAIAPAGYARAGHKRIGRITVAENETAESQATFETAAEIARLSELPVRVLTAVKRNKYDLLEAPGIEVLRGTPARALSRATGEGELLFVGSRRHGPRGRVLLGSCSALLAYNPPCPLVLLPRGAEDRLLKAAEPVADRDAAEVGVVR